MRMLPNLCEQRQVSRMLTLLFCSFLTPICTAQALPPSNAATTPNTSNTSNTSNTAALDAIAPVGRVNENAVRQADDAFGISVGRENIGLYNEGSVRGFSPTEAGNARIEGLYFDQVAGFGARSRQSTTIRVGLSALGYPFPAPTGIVDFAFRKPAYERSLSLAFEANSYGAAFVEFDAALPLISRTLSLGVGGAGYLESYQNATNAHYQNGAVNLRWNPLESLEVITFWNRTEGFDDEAGPIYIPAGDFLPPPIKRRRFNGPDWVDFRSSALNFGGFANYKPNKDWAVRAGVFRSTVDDYSSFAHLLVDLTQAGTAQRIIISDPPIALASTSGELRVTHQIEEGPRRHVFHANWRAREKTRRYDGSDVIDYGATTINERFFIPRPTFNFQAQTNDVLRQQTAGIAYEVHWPTVGEFGAGIQSTNYKKRLSQPNLPASTSSAKPILFNLNSAIDLGKNLVMYGAYTRGLEESGAAPNNANNRNELLPAIETSQREFGFRLNLNPKLKLIGGVFDVRKPYFNLNAENEYLQLGNIRNQGAEFSLAGELSPQLNLVAGAVLSRPRVVGEDVSEGRVGKKPVGLPTRRLELNLDWHPNWIEGLSFDLSTSYSGAVVATVNNRVSIPARTFVNTGVRYVTKVNGYATTLQLSVNNLFDTKGFDLRGAGAYDIIAGRLASAYLGVDF